MSDFNPRFPHTLVVKRVHRSLNGEIAYSASGDVTYDTVPLSICALNDGKMMRNSSGQPIISGTASSIKCGYRTDSLSTQAAGDVVTSSYCLHCPPFIAQLLYDDVLEITDYDRTYKARCVKKVTVNWGTNIWFEEIHN